MEIKSIEWSANFVRGYEKGSCFVLFFLSGWREGQRERERERERRERESRTDRERKRERK